MKCQEQHGGSYAGCVWGAPWRSRYYVYAIDYDRGGEWMGQDFMCTRDKSAGSAPSLPPLGARTQ
jgi:hypothetical protein